MGVPPLLPRRYTHYGHGSSDVIAEVSFPQQYPVRHDSSVAVQMTVANDSLMIER